jgi:hypothetical protein
MNGRFRERVDRLGTAQMGVKRPELADTGLTILQWGDLPFVPPEPVGRFRLSGAAW